MIAGAVSSCGTSLPPGAGEPEVESAPDPEPEPPPLTPAEREARARTQTAALIAEIEINRLRRVLSSPEALLMFAYTLLSDPQPRGGERGIGRGLRPRRGTKQQRQRGRVRAGLAATVSD